MKKTYVCPEILPEPIEVDVQIMDNSKFGTETQGAAPDGTQGSDIGTQNNTDPDDEFGGAKGHNGFSWDDFE